ncbi:potassium channel family protein [Ferruginibacter lapsinanis]|uniref:potassium channel family protein n=1 Tax=Ferruginibacter lapsinanis TaxID=563172 RepID=UPI001E64CAA1|nr:potassium channel family protein [Ferruginibacter lapsinanis]UEG50791.1 potassium channel family protein [Ferruginibacter lapsinanis]
MKQLIKKIFLARPEVDCVPSKGGLQKRVKNIKAIWHNEHQDDVGVEKMLRLFLAASQFVFLGIYIKHFFGKKGVGYQELSVDGFVLIKVIFPVAMLYLHLEHNILMRGLMIWFLVETILYLATLVFASDIFTRPRSYRRSMLLMFLNYLQIVFSFAALYANGNYLNKPFEHWFDSIYFSFVTSSTVGFGEYYPITGMGKLLVCFQVMIFFIVVVMFLNFFSNKVESKGYFDHTKNPE